MQILDSMSGYLQVVYGYLNTTVIALVILLAGFILGRLVDRVLHKAFLRLKFDDAIFSITRVRRHYARATRVAVVYAIYVLTVYVALRQLRLEILAITFVLAVLVLIVVVSITLATMEIVPHILGRWQLRSRGFQTGDHVEIKDEAGRIRGTIDKITLIDMRVKRKNGDLLFYPMSKLMTVTIRRSKK